MGRHLKPEDFATRGEWHAYRLGRSQFGAEVYEKIETMAEEYVLNPNAIATLRELWERLKLVYR